MRNRFRLISAGSGRIATERPDIDADMGAAPQFRHADRVAGREGRQCIVSRIAEASALRRVSTPGEIANMVRFLVGDGARQVTGQDLVVDDVGGLTADGAAHRHVQHRMSNGGTLR